MPDYRHLVRLPYTSGLPEDVTVNVFHSISDDDVEAAGFADALVVFYQTIDTQLSNLINETALACSVTTYRLTDPEPRVPVEVQTFTLDTSASTLPRENAICLSFQGTKLAGLNQARRRGRVYLGPLGAVHDTTTGRVLTTTVNAIATAADTLLGSASPGTVGNWAVFSPTNGTTVPVANGWVDNEFDHVLSRGIRANVRTTFS